MKRFASVTFDAALRASDRAGAVRSLGSAVAGVTSWSEAGDRTYALMELAAGENVLPVPAGVRVDEPPLVVLRIVPRTVAPLPALERAFGGPGRPRGVVEARPLQDALIVAVQGEVTSLALVVALADAVLGAEPGRRIEPLLPLDDATLAAFAGDVLGEPQLDATRLIETHLEPLLASVPA